MNIPKTGLSAKIRSWAADQYDIPFRIRTLAAALEIRDADGYDRVRQALRDFKARGEVIELPGGRYRYAGGRNWRPATRGGEAISRIYRAMFVVYEWSVSDLIRMTDVSDRSYINRLIRRLAERGEVTVARIRSMAPRPGKENIWRVVDRDRFRTEVMK